MRNAFARDNRGSALFAAIVVCTVLMSISLMVLAASYSYYMGALENGCATAAREAAKSLSYKLNMQIAHGEVYDSYEKQYAALVNAHSRGDGGLWFFLRYNVGQNSWKEYDSDSADKGESSKRYYQVDFVDNSGVTKDNVVDKTYVCLYWEHGNFPGVFTNANSGIILHMDVTCVCNNMSYTVERQYLLTAEDVYADVEDDVLSDTVYFNPNGNSICISEIWRWTEYDAAK